jgi:hypothetical protein
LRAVTHLFVRPVLADHEHVDRGDPAVFREPDFHAAVQARARAADAVFLVAADAHHHGCVELL